MADHALLIEFATEVSYGANQLVVALDRAISAESIPGVKEVVPGMVSLLVDFDPLRVDHERVEAAVRERLTEAEPQLDEGRVHTVHVCYDAAFGSDLSVVAELASLSEEAVIAAHLAGEYRVFMYGFAPGYAYLAGVPERIQVPRKAVPVRGVPAGSVIIAGPQCLVTTLEMPTGWSIIGRSPTRILLEDPVRPFRFDVGDRVRFERIDAAAFDRLVEVE
ncbi:MAG: allophanate hydrolase subunit 1 [Acidimicrobiia bacterium]|nr:allophanate hydrolase subunit 1 [Acidimicrobiia bacterium]